MPDSNEEPVLLTPGWLTGQETADRLGISLDAVRQRIKRGQLIGRKHEGRWLVRIDSLPGAVETGEPDDWSSSDRTTDQPNMYVVRQPDDPSQHDWTTDPITDSSTDQPDSALGPDLQPLTDLIDRMNRQYGEAMAAAAAWQTRALMAEQRAETAEQRIEALTAGDITSDQETELETAAPEPPRAPEPGNEGQASGSAISAASAGVLARLARWLRGNE